MDIGENTTVTGVENVSQHISKSEVHAGEDEGGNGGIVEDLNIEEDGGERVVQG